MRWMGTTEGIVGDMKHGTAFVVDHTERKLAADYHVVIVNAWPRRMGVDLLVARDGTAIHTSEHPSFGEAQVAAMEAIGTAEKLRDFV